MSASEQNNMEKELENIENQENPENSKPAEETEEIKSEPEMMESNDLSVLFDEDVEEVDFFSEKEETPEISEESTINNTNVTPEIEENPEKIISEEPTPEFLEEVIEEPLKFNSISEEATSENIEQVLSKPQELISELKVDLKKDIISDINKLKSNKRILQGKVVSNKSNKTILVLIERHVAHPLYKKYYKRSRKVMAHDPNNDCNQGDTVKVIESRPLSARKRWHLLEIVERAK
jgi:small subunit ribosomal protein S17